VGANWLLCKLKLLNEIPTINNQGCIKKVILLTEISVNVILRLFLSLRLPTRLGWVRFSGFTLLPPHIYAGHRTDFDPRVILTLNVEAPKYPGVLTSISVNQYYIWL